MAESVREHFDLAQWCYGHGLRAKSLWHLIVATQDTAMRRAASEQDVEHTGKVDLASAVQKYCQTEVHHVSIGHLESLPSVEVLGVAREFGWALCAIRAGIDGEDYDDVGMPQGADKVNFTDSGTLAVSVSATAITVPDLLIEGLATAVALAPENAQWFPPWPRAL